MKTYVTVLIVLGSVAVSVGTTFFLKGLSNKKKTPVTLYLMWEPQAQFLGYYAAREKGFFRDEGLDIVIKHDLGFGESFHEILARPHTYAINLLSNTVEWLSDDPHFAALSVINKGCSMGWLSKSKKEDLPQRLTNAHLYSWWGSQDILLKNLLLSRGSSISKLADRVHVGDPRKSDADWIVLVMNYNELVDYLSILDPAQTFSSYCDLNQSIFEDILVGAKPRSDEDRQVNERMIRAIWKGWDWCVQFPEEALDILMAISPRRPREIQRYQLKTFASHLSKSSDTTMHFEGNLRTLESLMKNGLVRRPENLHELLQSLRAEVPLRRLGI